MKKIYRHLLKTAGKYKKLMAVYFTLGLAQTFLQSFNSNYFKKLIDGFTAGTLTAFNVFIFGAAMISLYIICYLDEYPGRKLEHGIVLSLKTEALRKISVIAYPEYIKLGTGALIQRIENGAAAGESILFKFYLRFAAELLPTMIFSIGFIFFINRTVTAVILAGYAVVFLIANLLLKALYKTKTRILVNEEKFNHFLVRGFMEMVVFRIHRRFGAEIKKTESAAAEIVASKVKMAMIHEAFFVSFAILMAFVKIGVIAYGIVAKTLTIGEMIALIALVDSAYAPVAIFNVLYVQYKMDKIAFERYTEFLEAREEKNLSGGDDFVITEGEISFSGVDFAYDGRQIFKNFDLTVEKGRTTAFVGESGSGKSTALKLLVGLLRPQNGNISVDGGDINKINLDGYYRGIAYLPQEPPVFDGTLRENLVFDEAVDDARLIGAIKKAGLDSFYSKLEKGLETRIGERGTILSGGEKQQLALARLWFSDAKLVIFDEATSAIDNLTEEAVMKNVLELLAEKTVISVAHRLDSVRYYDRIVVFRDGQISEQGGFEQLLNNKKYFFELFNRSENTPKFL